MSKRTAVILGGLGFLGAGSLGHTFRPRAMARHYGWTSSPWYQRQLASFELPHLYGLLALLSGKGRIDDAAYLRIVSSSALLLGLHHALAIARGDRAGAANWISGGASAAMGLLGMHLAKSES